MNPLEIYLMSLNSKHSRNQALSVLRGFLDVKSSKDMRKVNVKSLSLEYVVKHLNKLESKGLSYRSINAHLSIIKGFIKQCWISGRISSNNYLKIDAIPQKKGYREPVGRSLSPVEVEKLFESCDKLRNVAQRRRAAAIIALGFFMGLRRSEIGGLRKRDIDFDKGVCRVIGKGNKEVSIPLSKLTLPYLKSWIEECRSQGVNGTFLFGHISSSGRILNLHGLRGEAVLITYNAVVSLATIQHKTTAHDMRRTLITNLLDQELSPRIVQAIARHNSIKTTLSYDRGCLENSMKTAVDGLSKIYTFV